MTRDDIIRMARKAGFHNPVRADGYMGNAYDRRGGGDTGGNLQLFAELVYAAGAAAEREACAEVCENYDHDDFDRREGAQECAELIRARGQA